MTFLHKSSLTLLSRAGIFIFGFVSQAWIARLLGPDGKGAYTLLALIPSLVAQFASLGIHNANIYLIGQKKVAVKSAAENALTFSLVIGGILLGLYWAARRWIDPILFRNIPPDITAWVSLAFPLHFVFLIFNYLALARDDIVSFNLPNVGRSAYVLLGLVLLTPWHKITLSTVNLIWVATNAVLAIQCWWLVFRRERFGLRWHPEVFRASVKFGLQSHLGTIFYLLGWRLDFLLCNIYLDTTAVGYYSIAVLLGEVLWFIPQTLAVILFPEVSRLDKDQSVRLTSQVCRLTLLSSIVGAILLMLLAPSLIDTIFGVRFLPALPPLWLLLPGMIFESGTRILSSFFIGRGFPMISTYSAALVFSSNLAINLWFIPHYGITGAAIASTFSYTLGAAYLLWSYRRMTGTAYTHMVLAQRDDWRLVGETYRRFRGSGTNG
ncbi:MAG: oligosaccharide flippase family protein [candidate division KSB1 bacterium]|nr:oligosaccharide flippase family protein [candidate division KSB1 bacterium]MDZ7302958.1 oligosaccharide flippase family protein [candidate division KSB1 bacterium]MDZ7312234.1 oligosaccharide flippase family protein [candidate division KSB1 bacterium]